MYRCVSLLQPVSFEVSTSLLPGARSCRFTPERWHDTGSESAFMGGAARSGAMTHTQNNVTYISYIYTLKTYFILKIYRYDLCRIHDDPQHVLLFAETVGEDAGKRIAKGPYEWTLQSHHTSCTSILHLSCC